MNKTLLMLLALLPSLPLLAQTCDPNTPPSTPESDFVILAGGVVRHQPTGLEWMRCALGMTWTGTTCGGSAGEYALDEARGMAQDLNGKNDLKGRRAWRVPYLEELRSIVEKKCQYPAIRTSIFPNIDHDVLSSSYKNGTYGPAYYLFSLRVGSVGGTSYGPSGSALLVRAGPLFDSLSFKPQTEVDLQKNITSDPITIGGLSGDTPLTIRISGGTYSINGGYFDNLPNSVKVGDQVRVQVLSSAKYGKSVKATLTVSDEAAGNGFTDIRPAGYVATSSFIVTTLTNPAQPTDTTPDAFSFAPRTGVAASTPIVSNPITVSGIDAPAPISVSGGDYSVNDGAYTHKAGQVKAGDSVRVRVTSAAQAGTEASVTLNIGGVKAVFAVTTAEEGGNPVTPAADWSKGVQAPVAMQAIIYGGASYGQALAASDDGLLVGAPLSPAYGQPKRGAVYQWKHAADGNWTEAGLPWSEGTAGDQYGGGLAVEGDWAAIAAPKADKNALKDIGRVYLYQRQGDGWSLAETLDAPEAYGNAGFGQALALTDGWLAVGAPGVQKGEGRVYLFALEGGLWSHRQTLTPSADGSQFGTAVALDGNNLVVGAPLENRDPAAGGLRSGSVHAYRLNGGQWLEAPAFPLPDAQDHRAGRLGANLVLQGNTLAVAAPDVNIRIPDGLTHSKAGRVFLYTFDETSQAWALGASPLEISSDFLVGGGAHFGAGLALADLGRLLLVGAPGADQIPLEGKQLDIGRSYLYQLKSNGWSIVQTFSGSGKAQGLGRSVALTADSALIGTQQGQVLLYQPR